MTYDLTRAAGSAGYGFALCTLLIPITWASQPASDFESCQKQWKNVACVQGSCGLGTILSSRIHGELKFSVECG